MSYGMWNQVLNATGYYLFLIVLMRLAGKRLAGQTTTFDLIVLISLGVVAQTAALSPGALNACVFIMTVFIWHRLLALLCARYSTLRHWVRGKPRVLIRDGRVLESALLQEGIGQAELMAGLRKLGYDAVEQVKTATLEETGHISAVANSPAS